MTVVESKATILVVEDDPSIAEFLVWALSEAGFEVRSAPTIADALQALDGTSPDVVVADLLLPDGLGSDLVRQVRLRGNGDSVATVVVSAHPRAPEHAAAAGADACLPKPFDLDDFYRTIQALVESRGTGPGLDGRRSRRR